MDMISTKELAERWQVSPSRIVRLAKAGRIPGAKLVGKSWVFPPDTKKPSDGRRKEVKVKKSETEFRFPLYFYCRYTDEEVAGFGPDERTLYEGARLYYCGEYQKCCDILTPLQKNTGNIYVRFGALYYLSYANYMLHNCREAINAFNIMYILFTEETRHRKELEFPIHDLETYFKGNDFYLENFTMDPEVDYPADMKDYLILQCAYSDMLKAFYAGESVNTMIYELFSQNERDNLSPLTALTLHLYTALICEHNDKHDRSVFHVREACRIAEENNMETQLSFLTYYKWELFQDALGDNNPEMISRMKSLSNEIISAFRSYLEYTNKEQTLQVLDTSEIRLIQFATKGMTNKEIASVLNLSMNTISKKYSLLFEKTDVHSKSELVRLYNKSIRNY